MAHLPGERLCPRTRALVAASAVLVLLATAALAQTPIQVGQCPFDRPLVEPPVLTALFGILDTTLTVRMVTTDVPVWANIAPFGQPPVYQCTMTKLDLRQYSWRSNSGAVVTGFPGPTLKLRKASSRQTVGDALTVHLVNELPVGPNDQCNVGCDCSDPDPTKRPRCCASADTYPACFHGDNNTNLHFHGTHVSPQAPQDFVTLELRPKGAVASDDSGMHDHAVRVGTYDYVLDPFRYTQPEGTHWYHPHKHGATALQVGNGMAGALIVEGKFDDDLRALFGGRLKENLLVLQVIHPLNFSVSVSTSAVPLINGQPSPVIDMYPGEIRRLRILAATVEADGAATIDFNGPQNNAVEARQIAMDGIEFAPENYARQPLLDANGELDVAPGNRADVLVKAPAAAGTYDVTYALRVSDGNAANGVDLKKVAQQIAPDSAEPRLFRIRVTPCPAGASCPPMSFPKASDFPKMPDFLADLPEKDVSLKRNVYFEMEDPQGSRLPSDKIPSQPARFYINLSLNEHRQFNPGCVDMTNVLGQTQEWTVWNTSNREPVRPLHIFHIHTNAFQVIHHPLKPKMNTPPYVWQDSVLLPDVTQGPVVIRQKFNDFTGEFVIHCHFLGHEDRGMMLGVQVVCPNDSTKFGTPVVNHGDDCSAPALTDAMPTCPAPPVGRRHATEP